VPRLAFPPGFEGSGGGGAPGSLDVAVAASADDGRQHLNTGDTVIAGTSDTTNSNNEVGWRFVLGATKPYVGATITTGYLTIRHSTGISGPRTLQFSGQKTNSTVSFVAGTANFDMTGGGRPRTTATVDWVTPDPTVTSTDYDTPSLATIIQEVVNQPSWDGNSMVLFARGTAGSANRVWRMFDFGVPAILHLIWT
jgi:hypothetical protein